MGLLSTNFGNAIAARRTVFSRAVRAFVSQPEPRSIGLPARGLQMMSGNFLFAGELVEAPDSSIWRIKPPGDAFAQELHGFGWLDHLAAEGSAKARSVAQTWLHEWIAAFGSGRGLGWTPQLTGRRVVRWINHGLILLHNQSAEDSKAYFKSLGHQASFLSARWKAAPRGLPRFEALTGLIYCGLALETKRNYLSSAKHSLGTECREVIGPDGSLPTRNPEELLNTFTLLTWASLAITEAGETPHKEHLLALERIVPLLRSLRLGDGGLVNFHGGGRGPEGRLDQSLADAAIWLEAYAKGGMGYQRMAHAGALLLMDVGPQPTDANAYASPLAFEMSSGRQTIISNAGPGHIFGSDTHEIARSISAHSTLNIAGQQPVIQSPKRKQDAVHDPVYERSENTDFEMLVAGHSYYGHTHGLSHFRTLEMAKNGRLLRGKDRVFSDTDAQREQFDAWFKKTRKRGMPIFSHFHIPPEVEVEEGLAGTAVSLTLPNGEVWVLQAPDAKMEIRPSLSMQFGRLRPRETKQIVLSDKAYNYEGVIDWVLTRA